ncbi:DNA helicase RecQ [Brucepastera parasyntrophica]|uniref:DNA helicase RecQ n=1 Tax=Brucepastera parasyntrophica TaxID=2880008 RepID=UPI00210C5057|nr:DNA helicase RecQ [Brucepastera parasyntrophica]ULQ61174.1 DNA helicase RecQ [Brucepastera parasyntrophica]
MAPRKILKTVFGYDSFRPLQEEIIEGILEKRDTLAVMPTGGGKSVCYQIPALLFPGLTVVVSPLIALMQDQVSALALAGVEALFLNSALDWETYRSNMAHVRSGKIKLLFAAPETLMTNRLQELLFSVRVDCIAIDEAHCISEWGHDFRPEYRRIAEIRELFPDAVCLALTATATPQVCADIKKTLKMESPAVFTASFNRTNIFLDVKPRQKPLAQVLEFLEDHQGESGIIYCFSRKQVDSLTAELRGRRISALPYHAGLSDEERTANQAQFIQDDVQIMIATVAFGMGINKPNVRFVIHFDLPKSLEQYYQEVGRAGRDGEPAYALLLYSYGDTRKIRFFIEQKPPDEFRKAEIHLKAMTDFAGSRICRRKILLEYFGEKLPEHGPVSEKTDCCDICRQGPSPETDMTIPVQKILSCIIRTGERFGAAYIIDILLGSGQKRIVDNGHNKLPVWGIGRDMPKEDWFEIIRLLVENEYLRKSEDYNVLTLSQAGRNVLKERSPVDLPFAASGAAGSVKKKKAGEMDGHISFQNPDRFRRISSELKDLRRRLAKESSVPPYVIFSDKTIEHIAAREPVSRSALLDIYGIGEVKAERYGDFITQTVKRVLSE